MITFVSPSVSYAGVWPRPYPSPTFPYLLAPDDLVARELLPRARRRV